jgi:alkylglycerol monooxygenase
LRLLVFPALALLAAVIDWIGVGLRRPWLEYLGKPLTMVFLIVWLVLGAGAGPAFAFPTLLFLGGLVFSLAGDILLMLPTSRFLAGLVFFLLAHLSYIASFSWNRGPLAPGEWLVAAGIAILLALLLPPVRAGLRRSGRPSLVIPVVIYAAVLGGMLWTSVGTRLHSSWLAAGATWIAFGGAAFFASDVSLVWDRFVAPLPGRRVTTHVLYHVAQLALTAGVLTALWS